MKRAVWIGVIVLVVVGLVLAWPHVFGPSREGRGPLLPGNPAEEHTPDPVAGTESPVTWFTGTSSSESSTEPEEDEDDAGESTPPPKEPTGVAPQPVDDGAERSPEAATLMADAEQCRRRGEVLRARSLLCQALASGPNAAQRADIVKGLTEVCGQTILGPRVWTDDPETAEHVVASGDYLSTIGRRYSIPYELIRRLNGLSSDLIYPNQKLKVVKGPFRVRVVKRTFTLELWLRDILVRTYRVAIGANDTTPSGAYTVRGKEQNPTFYPPPSLRGVMAVTPGGHPDNPLGARWIGFGNHLGVHGTNEPQHIGKRVSLGCIRMLNADVEYLYDCLVIGATVEIVD